MAGKIESRLAELGITLPEAPSPAGAYVPCRQSGRILLVSGQVSLSAEGRITGKLGADMDVEAGKAAARVCGINLLSQVRAHCGGDLDRVTSCLQLVGYVNAVPDFVDHPQVINGASELMLEVFGEVGLHTRAAVGMGSLPLGVAVEVSGTFELSE